MHRKLLAAALAAALLAPATATADDAASTAPVDLGLAFLRAAQQPDGSIGGPAGSDWSAIALGRAADADCADVRVPGGVDLLTYLTSTASPSWPLPSLERRTLALAACGADPTAAAGFDLVAAILAAFDGTQLGDPATLNDDIFGLLALHAAGVPGGHPVVAAVREYLVRQQQPSGAWGFGAIRPDVDLLFNVAFADTDLTSQAVVALGLTAPAGADPRADLAMSRGLAFLKLGQWLDGGCQWSPWAPAVNAGFGVLFDPVGTLTSPAGVFGSNGASTAWAMTAVTASHMDPEGPLWTSPTGGNLVSFLVSLQAPDGHFQWQAGQGLHLGDETMTAWAVVALAGHTFAS